MLYLSCKTLPLFIGKENGVKQAKIFVGRSPNKRQAKNSRWNLSADFDCCRSTGPVDRQRADFPPLGKRLIGPVDRKSQTESDHSLSVDRTGRPDQRESSALSADRLRRSTDVHNAHWCMSVDRPDRRQSSFDLPAFDRVVDRTRPNFTVLENF